jgi:hypothetical protein
MPIDAISRVKQADFRERMCVDVFFEHTCIFKSLNILAAKHAVLPAEKIDISPPSGIAEFGGFSDGTFVVPQIAVPLDTQFIKPRQNFYK